MRLSIYGYRDIKQGEGADMGNRTYRHTMIATDVESNCLTPEERDSLEEKIQICFGGIAIVTCVPTGEMSIIFTVDNVLVSGTDLKPEFIRLTQAILNSCFK